NFLVAVLPRLKLEAHQLGVLGQSHRFGQNGQALGAAAVGQGGPGRLEQRFIQRSRLELNNDLVQEVLGVAGNRSLHRGEVVEEGAAGNTGGDSNVVDRERGQLAVAQEIQGR